MTWRPGVRAAVVLTVLAVTLVTTVAVALTTYRLQAGTTRDRFTASARAAFDSDAQQAHQFLVRSAGFESALLGSQARRLGAPAEDAVEVGAPGVPVRRSGDATVFGDPRRLHTVVRNLVANAVRHGGPPVTVTVDGTAPDRVRVVVADSGPGLPADLAPVVFDRFVRGDRARSRTEGSGPGPAIAQENARPRGGRLEVHNDGGAVFTFTVPRGRRPFGRRRVQGDLGPAQPGLPATAVRRGGGPLRQRRGGPAVGQHAGEVGARDRRGDRHRPDQRRRLAGPARLRLRPAPAVRRRDVPLRTADHPGGECPAPLSDASG